MRVAIMLVTFVTPLFRRARNQRGLTTAEAQQLRPREEFLRRTLSGPLDLHRGAERCVERSPPGQMRVSVLYPAVAKMCGFHLMNGSVVRIS